MKNTFRKSICIVLALVCLLGLAACKKEVNAVEAKGLWKDATYLEDMTFGEGKNTAIVEVKAGEQSVTFTVNTDEEMLGAALLEHKLIDGDQGDYGLYIKKVNGITADYDTDKAYWGFYINGEYATTGVDSTKIEKDATYKLEYTK